MLTGFPTALVGARSLSKLHLKERTIASLGKELGPKLQEFAASGRTSKSEFNDQENMNNPFGLTHPAVAS
jgi:hypothetical protein